MVAPLILYMLATVQADDARAQPVDLAKLPRAIAKEPPRITKQPRYCLLVFGIDGATRIWLVADGLCLYVDRNGDGDLSDPSERVDGREFPTDKGPSFEVNDLVIGKDLTATLRVMIGKSADDCDSICMDERRHGQTLQLAAGVDPSGILRFSLRPEDAPIVHFNGPLRMSLRAREVLRRGEDPRMFTAMIGTPGIGSGTFVGVCTDCVPEGVHPIAEITWRARPDQPTPPPTKVYLRDRC